MEQQRGALLIEELPSVLQGYGSEFLHIVIELGEKIVESNLKEELLLGEAMFDPFELMQALDRCPATTAFWSVLLTECRENLAEEERALKVITSTIKLTISDIILDDRPANSNKMPSAAEIEDRFVSWFLTEGTSEIDDLFPVTGEGDMDNFAILEEQRKNLIALKIRLETASARAEELQKKVTKVEIVHQAWKDKAFMLQSQANLMQTLINQELIKIPKQRAVYEKW